MDRKVNILLPEDIWRTLDPNNKSADARALMKDGLEYRKIKKQLVERAFQIQTKDAVLGFQTHFSDFDYLEQGVEV